MAEAWRVRLINTPADLDAALRIREIVFVQGQGVPADLEVDGLDPQSTHLLAEAREQGAWLPVGAARLRRKGELAKAERVAVLERARGHGVGALLMAALEDEAEHQGLGQVFLHAQTSVVEFYLKLGYQSEGPEFEEAGIAHQAMRKVLPRRDPEYEET